MTYATLTDLIARAGATDIRETADRDGDGMPDPDVVAAALADADNIVNGYLAVRYTTPLTSVPEIVLTWSVSIARYILHRYGAPDHVTADYKDAIAQLKDVSSGRMALPVAEGESAAATATGQVMAEHPPQVFTPAKLRGWN